MKVIVPKYLDGWTQVKKNAKDSVVLEAVCECGHSEFLVFENIVKRTAEQIEREKEIDAFEKRCGWRSIEGGVLEDGKYYMYRKNLFGKIVDKVEISDGTKHTNIIKIKCAKCGKEHLAFDGRIHGYDAFVDMPVPSDGAEIEFERWRFKSSKNNVFGIEIHIFNQYSFEEFCEENDGCSEEDFSNAFGDITVYAKIKELNDKKVIIFSKETA